MTTIQTAHSPFAPCRACEGLEHCAVDAAGAGRTGIRCGCIRKARGSADMVALFDAVGIGQWFRYVTGSLEGWRGSAHCPRQDAFGAVLLACVMAGAVVAHFTVLQTRPLRPSCSSS